MTDLPQLVAELRREADANVLDCVAMLEQTPERLLLRTQMAPHRILEIRGVPVRISLTRDRIGTRDFYHLSVSRSHPTVPDGADLAALQAAFFPSGGQLPLPSLTGSSYQFLGPPFANDTPDPEEP